MKIALLGTGRTGSKVIELHGASDIVEFNTKNPPTSEGLAACDVGICFLPGAALSEHLDSMIESKIPFAVGSTGMEWPDDLDSRLKGNSVTWIRANNFALGMNIIYGAIKILAKAPQLFDNFEYKIHEIHHIHKKDQPSGTALLWKDWLDREVEITSSREGDNPGYHKLSLVTPFEDISLDHQSKDRKIFAEGALWAAKRLHAGNLPSGLHNLQSIMEKELEL